MENQERDLILQAQAGELRAFDALVRIHDRRVFQIVFSMLGNLHDTQDAYQDAFLNAFARIDTFRFESRFSTWLIRIAVNASINLRRKKKVRQWFSLSTEYQEEAFDRAFEMPAEEGPERQYISQELRRLIEKGLGNLSVQQRAVFVLKHFQHYKIREIAEILECVEGTVKNQLFRAARKLQKFLAPFYEDKDTQVNV